jgi:hypothetical protein
MRLLYLLPLLLCACGGNAPQPKTPSDTPDKTDSTAGGHESLAPDGEDVDRLCNWYSDSLRDQGDEVTETPAETVARCKTSMQQRTPAERTSIADCFNSCGASDGIVRCFEDFGTPSFPACGPDDYEEEEPASDGEE